MDETYYGQKLLPDGREISVIPLLFGRARLVISLHPGDLTYDDGW